MCKVKLERLLAPLGLAIVWLALTLGILSLGVSTSQAAPLQTTDVLPVSVPTGQVLPHKAAAVSASNVPSISNVTGATYDADRGEMVVFGIADPALPALDYAHVQENLAIAMRALYDSNGPEIPGVSIEGTLDPLDVIYFGNVTDTHFGQVSFESDRLLKIYTLGKDNLTGITVTSNVTGYMSYPDRMELLTETVTDSILIRYFFTPTLRIKQITTPHTIIFSPTVHFIDWAYMSAETSTATTEAAQGFVDNFNQHYLDYAAERWAVYSDTTLYEMAQLAKLTAVGQWVYDQGLELPGMNTPWLDHYPISHAATVTQTPGITVTWVQTISGTPYDSSLRGGVYAYGILEWLLGTLEDQEIANDAQNGIKPPQPQYMPCHLRPTQRCPRRPFGVTCIATPGPLMGYVIPLADNAVANGGFEGGPGSAPWNQNSIFEMIMAGSARSGDYAAQFPVYHNAQVAMFQTLYIPADATTARVTYWRAVATAETTHPWDFFASFLTDGDGARLATFEGLDDGDADGYWHQVSFDAGSYAGQTVQLWFTATTNGSNITNFFVDDISLDYLDPTPPTVMTVTTTDVGTRRRPSPAKPIATNKAIMTGAVEFHIVFHEHMKPSVVPTVTIRHQVSQTMYTLTAKTETGYTNGYLDSDPTNWYGTYTFTLQMEDGTYDLDVSAAQDVAGNVMYTATNAYTFVFDATSPQVQGISPANGASDMPVDASVVITFSEAINTNTFSYSVSPDPGGWAASWNAMTDVVTLTHNAFMTGTLYTVTVTSAGDLAGNPLDGAPVIWSFTTFVPDTTAPEVVGTSPVNDASEVAVDANIVITFSEAISTNTFSYSVSPDPGGWAASWNAMTDVVTLTHNAFMTGTLYTVTVTAADDLADNPLDGASVIWSFTTLVPDTVVPEILGVFPINNASEVVVDANIVITFSEAISTNTFLYSISPDPGGWTVSWNGMNDMVTLTHNTFMTGTRYTITVTAAEDLARNPLDGAPVTWSFTTSNIDTALPKIVGVFPPNGTSEVTVDTSIVITFNEAVSIGTFSYFVSPNPGGWVENWDSTNNVVALTHNAFMTSTRYTVTVTAADDLAGNPLDRAPVTWSFTTFAPDTVAPELLGTVPSNDASEVTVDANIVITFSEAINTGTFSYSVSPDPGGWTASWNVMTDVVTLTHNTFMTSTRYTITVTAADDLAGNPLDGAPVTWFFTTAAIDTAAPKMLGKSPTNGASEVVVDANIIITFSEAINTGMFSYSVSPDPGGWTENWNSMNNVVTLTHNAFMTGTHYTVTVTAADDLAGNPLDDAPVTWSFTTFAPDAIAPEILGTSPVSSVSEAAVDANIVITFSEAISTGTFSYSISPDPGGWAASWNGTSNVVTLTHNTFMTGTRYTVTVTAADDLAGNPLDGAPVTWSFTTAAIDTVAPKILGTLPLDGASGVPANADIVITFSEAISTNTLIYSVFPDPGGWAASWNETNSAATLTHNAFMAGTQYTVTVTEAKDLANNSLNGTPATWSFTTLSQTYLPVVFRHAE